jgi:hypothetical protein
VTAVGSPLQLVLVHIPKTAGTTLGSLLLHHYGDRYQRVDMSGVHVRPTGDGLEVLRHLADGTAERLDRFELRDGVEVVSGHAPVGLLDLLPPAERYVTILRDPVERTLSQYYHLLGRRAAWRHEWLPAPTPELRLSDAIGERSYIPDNLQTRMLCGVPAVEHPLPPDALDRAKRELRERFSYVGTTERFEELVALLNLDLGWPTVAVERARVNAARPRGHDVPVEEIRLAEEANALDRELYLEAGRLHDERVARSDEELQNELEVLRLARLRRAGEPGVPIRVLPVEARVELAVQESDLLDARAELRDAARRYAKRTEQWRELKRAAKRKVGVLSRKRR